MACMAAPSNVNLSTQGRFERALEKMRAILFSTGLATDSQVGQTQVQLTVD